MLPTAKRECRGVSYQEAELVNWTDFARSRSELGSAFLRILGYFREDGAKAIGAIEEAVRALNAAALVTPAHTLKGESAQFDGRKDRDGRPPLRRKPGRSG